ncbi:MAG TPA: 30S ribosomal protein S1 [Candidatus Babeliales bacterium]|jgi:small subunit ribosomal protein S1|nr:30S ribosomal protein S1 [Candidatus Babeliales bacterium]
MSKELIRPEQFCAIRSKSLINEDILLTSPEIQEELNGLYEGIFNNYTPGKPATATIIRVDSDGVLIDIGCKSYGLIPKFEFGPHELKNLVVGDTIEVLIEQLENAEGHVVVSYERAKAMRAWDRIVKLFESEEPVQGIVTHKVKGGLSVDIGIDAFLPGSQIDLQRVTDFDQYVGQKITANILKINRKRGNVIISRRKYLSDIRADARKRVLTDLQPNQIIQGVVKNITNYGAFIDIGGVDGLLHITDMTWGRIAHPSELISIGDTITVMVLSFDKDTEKISLGLKQLTSNPWEEVERSLVVGSRIKGKISSITDYGLFVEVAPNIEGLVHISEVSWTDRIENLHSLYKVGDEIEVLLVSLDKENRRMSLSIKQLSKNPWEQVTEQFTVGQKIHGTISNITDFGIFVQLLPGIDGLVHISDLSWTEHVEHPKDKYHIGQEIDVIVLSIDKDNKKISLGVKQLTPDPWSEVETLYPVGSLVNGVVSKVTNFGAFIRLPNGIEGLVHNTTLQSEQSKKAEEYFTIGNTYELRVIAVSKQDRKLALSTRLEGAPATQQVATPAPAKTATSKSSSKKTSTTQSTATSGTQAASTGAKSAFQLALESAIRQREEKENSKADKE